ncbi:DUF5343 domain-containing protein [Microbacterium sp. 22242]|uniref:DUF5343 domain-containing protein n=1 Tax=Microbacterium sp. 22242 TaxID=3453896 RepID=UPI003F852046
MAESSTGGETKVSYPYLSANQWNGIRASLKQSVPKTIDVDWVIAKLDTTQKSAQNVLPQLKALGIVDADGRPSDLIPDLRDDDTYAAACQRIVERVYADGLRNAYSESDADPVKVAAWFARNAGTGDVMSRNQAKLYLLLLGGELPSADDTSAQPKPRKKSATPASTARQRPAADSKPRSQEGAESRVAPPTPPAPSGGSGVSPSLHIDMQIHISADAGDAQIEAIFKSMAKHLYGR